MQFSRVAHLGCLWGGTEARSHEGTQGRGFTLIELMISIALVVILLLGVNMIFKMASGTVSIGTTISAQAGDKNGMGTVLQSDFASIDPQSPVFIIHSSLDPAGNRQDMLRFFTRGLVTRHATSGFISDTQSIETYVCYGPTGDLAISPDKRPRTDILGRNAILLREQAANVAPEGLYVRNPPRMLMRAVLPDLSPLANFSVDNLERSVLPDSHYDLAATSIARFREDVTAIREAVRNGGGDPDDSAGGPGRDWNWWVPLVSMNPAMRTGHTFFACDPRIGKVATPRSLAVASPYLVGNVSNFRVEYAGDFVAQELYEDLDGNGKIEPGKVVAPEPDGRVDFCVVPGPQLIVKTRWYGLPRDANGDGRILAADDVVPLRDLRRPFVNPNVREQAAFERVVPMFSAAYTPQQLASGIPYVCIWVNGAPPLVRVAMRLEDPTGRLQEGQWCEYVLSTR